MHLKNHGNVMLLYHLSLMFYRARIKSVFSLTDIPLFDLINKLLARV
jgi:hypothetical protein